MKGRRTAVAAMALLCACTHTRVEVHERDVKPVSYAALPGTRLERTTGRLRRVAFAVTPFDASPRDPRWCLDPCDVRTEERRIADRVFELLRDWRGYDVVRADGSVASDAEGVATLGRSLDVDGVFVLRGDVVYLSWADAALGIATLTFSFPLSMARVGTRVELALYDTARGRLVWRSVSTAGGSPQLTRNLADSVIEPLEPAWPIALTKAAPPSEPAE